MRAGEWCDEHLDGYGDCSFLHNPARPCTDFTLLGAVAVESLPEFLLSRLAESESRAWRLEGTSEAAHLGKWLRADCEAKRQIIQLFTRGEHYGVVLRLLALPYADHPDYRDEWKP